MPRNTVIVQVFVASPSDVADEREILDSVVSEWNRTWSQSLGVSFELIKWETHVRPGFSVDPQAVVNSQITDDYDVFLGVFWSRVGTPTARAQSGSIEEFERAYDRFVRTGSPEIMIYFKEAPLAPSKIDGAQFTRLQEFRKSLATKGGLLSEFENAEGFEASLRTHLSAVAQRFARAPVGLPTPALQSSRLVQATAQEIDYGLVDYLEIYEARTRDMTAAISIVNEATGMIGGQLTNRNLELRSDGCSDSQSARRHMKQVADDMLRYAKTLDVQFQTFASARQEAFDALSSAVALMPDFPSEHEHLRTLSLSLLGTIEAASAARDGLSGMCNAAKSIPRISKELNGAKRAVVWSLEKFIMEFGSTEFTVKNIIEAINRLLDSSAKPLAQ